MRHFIVPLSAALCLTAASIVSAFAHSTLEKGETAPGSYKAVLRVPHGCDGKATHTVRVEVPEGYIGVKPMPKAGWQLAVEKGDYATTYKLHGRETKAGTRTVTWSGGNLADDFYDEFVLSGSIAAEAGQTLYFKTTQLCDGGEVSWNEIPAAGQNPHSLAHPAPALKIAAAGGGHDEHAGHDMSAMGGAPAATADALKAGDLEISAGWVRAMLPGQPAGGGYLTVKNKGAAADRLLSVATPGAGKSEIHSMEMKDNVMVMRPVAGGLEIPAGGSVELKPGGFHLMFMQVAKPYAEGDTVPVTLQFEKAGKVELSLPVTSARGGK